MKTFSYSRQQAAVAVTKSIFIRSPRVARGVTNSISLIMQRRRMSSKHGGCRSNVSSSSSSSQYFYL